MKDMKTHRPPSKWMRTAVALLLMAFTLAACDTFNSTQYQISPSDSAQSAETDYARTLSILHSVACEFDMTNKPVSGCYPPEAFVEKGRESDPCAIWFGVRHVFTNTVVDLRVFNGGGTKYNSIHRHLLIELEQAFSNRLYWTTRHSKML
jgi:hypothetical protein